MRHFPTPGSGVRRTPGHRAAPGCRPPAGGSAAPVAPGPPSPPSAGSPRCWRRTAPAPVRHAGPAPRCAGAPVPVWRCGPARRCLCPPRTPRAPEKPSPTAPRSQRTGQGMALRTETRGALTVSRLRMRRNLIQTSFDWELRTRITRPPNAKTAPRQACRRFLRQKPGALALAELLGAACGTQTDLLTFDFAGIARDETGLRQARLERGVVVDQGAGDAVAHSAGLAGFAATVHVDHHVEGFGVVGQQQRLLGDHDRGLTAEVGLDVLAVDHDLAGAFFQKHTGDAGFATAGAIVPFTNHLKAPLEFQHLRLLGGVGMLSTAVHLELLDHGVAERALGQHALDGLLDRAARVLGLHVAEVGGVDTAGVTRVTVVNLVEGFGARHADFGRVDDDDVVTGIDVRRVNGLVFAAQTESHFTGNSSEDLVGRVNHKPLVLHVSRFGAERSSHEFSL